jgi:nitronate monooxygenase
MTLPPPLTRLRLPVIGAPLFIVSNPDLVIAQCKAGIVGSFPALNARPQTLLDEWLHRITEELAAWDRQHPDRPSAPFAVNQIVHRSNARLQEDMATCAKWKVPIVITSLGAIEELNQGVHAWGGITLHDIIDDRFARKAVAKGADGLIAVAAGAGGHAGRLSPFALVQEIREWFDGPLALSGAIANGRSILAAQALGADFAYIGSPFIATEKPAQATITKAELSMAGRPISSIRASSPECTAIICAGRSKPPGSIPTPCRRATSRRWISAADRPRPGATSGDRAKGIGAVREVQPAAAYIDQLAAEYEAAKAELGAKAR